MTHFTISANKAPHIIYGQPVIGMENVCKTSMQNKDIHN